MLSLHQGSLMNLLNIIMIVIYLCLYYRLILLNFTSIKYLYIFTVHYNKIYYSII